MATTDNMTTTRTTTATDDHSVRDPEWDYGRMSVPTRIWRAIVGAIAFPFLIALGVFLAEPGDADPQRGYARAMAWTIEPFTRPKPRPKDQARQAVQDS